ncbi:hypothetical protein HMPREF1144_4433 [Klebsiella sp. OBRC7]|nr:hypothetical protein HMPREF1144_4433 [Klebsiella sp. OBRC7]
MLGLPAMRIPLVLPAAHRLRGPTAKEGCAERLGFVGRVRR